MKNSEDRIQSNDKTIKNKPKNTLCLYNFQIFFLIIKLS